jgi:hypothetical protein
MPPSRIQIAKASSSNATATPLVHRLLDREFVVPALQVLYEAMPGDHDPGAAILLEAPHRTKPCLQPTMIAFDSVIGVAVGAMPGRWQQLLQHDWRAAAASRRGETNTSMTWPNWSIAR